MTATMLLALAACSGEPYGDEKLENAVEDVDHVSSVNGTCSHEGVGSWSCHPVVRMSEGALAEDVVAASDRVVDMLDPDRSDTATITVGRTSERGVEIDLTARSTGTTEIADAARRVLDLNTSVKAQFREDGRRWLVEMGLEAGSFRAFAEHGRTILDASGAAHLRFSSREPEILGAADRGTWPQAELDVLAAVQRVTTVRSARLSKGFLSVVVRSRAPQARRAAAVVDGLDSIRFVDITSDPGLDLYGLTPGQAAAVAPLLRQARRGAGFRTLDVEEGGLEIATDTLAQARSIDRTLHAGLARADTSLRVTYRAKQDGITVERGVDGVSWFDTAEQLAGKGLFDAVTITRVDAGPPQVDVRVRPPGSPRAVARALARSWQPSRRATFHIHLQSGDMFFEGAERIKVRPSSSTDSDVDDDVVAGWAEGRKDP